MAVKNLLDFSRVDVVAATDDQVLGAVDDEVETVLVAIAEVAGVQPAAAQRGLGRLRLPAVTLHDVVAADEDLADVVLARRQWLVVLAADAHLHAPDGLADRERPAIARAVERGRATGLGQAIALEYVGAVFRLERAHHFLGQRCAAGNRPPERRQVPAADVELGQRVQHRRHAGDDGDVVALDGVKHRTRREPGQDAEAGAVANAHVDDGGQAEDVKERQHGQEDVVRPRSEELARDCAVHVQQEMRELGAFGLTGRSAGVDEYGRVIGVARNSLAAGLGERRAADQFGESRRAIRHDALVAGQVQRHP